MGVLHIFKIVQMAPNHAKRLTYSIEARAYVCDEFFGIFRVEFFHTLKYTLLKFPRVHLNQLNLVISNMKWRVLCLVHNRGEIRIFDNQRGVRITESALPFLTALAIFSLYCLINTVSNFCYVLEFFYRFYVHTRINFRHLVPLYHFSWFRLVNSEINCHMLSFYTMDLIKFPF